MLDRLMRRRRAAHEIEVEPEPQVTPPNPAAVVLDEYPGVSRLLDAGDIQGAMALVGKHHPGLDDRDRARIELQLRHEAFERHRRTVARPEAWPPRTERTSTPADGFPEVRAEDLDVDAVIAGVQHHGALIVRGLFPPEVAAHLTGQIDRAIDTFAGEGEPDPDWHVPLCDLAGVPLSPRFRSTGYVIFDGQVAAADTPRVAEYILDQFTRTGVNALIEEYLGERPALSLEKWTLRRVAPSTNSSWHQDGAFLGTGTRTLNLWIALSDCGEEASGLDLVGRRFDHIVPTGTPGAYFDWDVSPDVVDQERGTAPIVSPAFQAGDAVFFDQFLLHRTGIREGLSKDRYALESWFFSPSSFLDRYAGLLV